jgi:hypothetical protein
LRVLNGIRLVVADILRFAVGVTIQAARTRPDLVEA